MLCRPTAGVFDTDVLSMEWRDVLLLHWPVAPAAIAEALPDALRPAIHDGRAWLGVVAFEMRSIRPRGLPPSAGRSFPELNLRTYVDGPAGPGVYFLSLDAVDRLGVAAARRLFALPYYRAEARVNRCDGWIRFRSRRTHPNTAPARFDAMYRPTGPAFEADPGSLAAFLAENYRFYAASDRLCRGRIDHDPWRLRPAEAQVRSNTLPAAAGLDRPDGDPVAHYAQSLAVTAGPIRPVASTAPVGRAEPPGLASPAGQ